MYQELILHCKSIILKLKKKSRGEKENLESGFSCRNYWCLSPLSCCDKLEQIGKLRKQTFLFLIVQEAVGSPGARCQQASLVRSLFLVFRWSPSWCALTRWKTEKGGRNAVCSYKVPIPSVRLLLSWPNHPSLNIIISRIEISTFEFGGGAGTKTFSPWQLACRCQLKPYLMKSCLLRKRIYQMRKPNIGSKDG